MTTKTQGSAEKMMKDLGKRIDELIEDLKVAKDKAKVEFADEIEELKRNRDVLESEIKGFREKHKDRFDEAERSLQKAGKEIKKAFDDIFKK